MGQKNHLRSLELYADLNFEYCNVRRVICGLITSMIYFPLLETSMLYSLGLLQTRATTAVYLRNNTNQNSRALTPILRLSQLQSN